MSDQELTEDDVLRIVELAKSSAHLTEFYLKAGAVEIDLRTRAESNAAPRQSQRQLISSPWVGTFHRAPSPGAMPYVEAGAPVAAQTTICCIDVLGTMHAIPAGHDGVVAQILVEDMQSVEFGQPLIIIES